MPDKSSDELTEAISNTVARAVCGLLLVWVGAALLLHWGWGVGLVGAGTILLGAQAFRRYVRVKIDGFGLVAGLVLFACGVWNLLDVRLEFLPLLCIVAGLALLVSIWTAKGPGGASGGRHELHAPPHSRT